MRPAATPARPREERLTRATKPVRREALRRAHGTRRRRWPRIVGALAVLAALVMLAGGWWVESRIQHVSALSGAPATPGQTYLIVGSDARDGWRDDGTTGARTDTIMLLHQPESGPTALISLPRDSYVNIPGHGGNKINAAFAFGGPHLLVETVEELTGLTIDRYVEVGFLGVEGIVDALGGVELCYEHDVNDPYSEMVWSAGCHEVGGAEALAFSRMRYADPIGDIGRVQRQQQVVAAVAQGITSPSTIANPVRAQRVASAGLDSFRVSDGTHVWDLVRMAQVMRAAQGDDAVTGTPPIATIDHRVDGVGSTVLLDPDAGPGFWTDIRSGAYPAGTSVGGYS